VVGCVGIDDIGNRISRMIVKQWIFRKPGAVTIYVFPSVRTGEAQFVRADSYDLSKFGMQVNDPVDEIAVDGMTYFGPCARCRSHWAWKPTERVQEDIVHVDRDSIANELQSEVT
jgi:hypothetical protein